MNELKVLKSKLNNAYAAYSYACEAYFNACGYYDEMEKYTTCDTKLKALNHAKDVFTYEWNKLCNE